MLVHLHRKSLYQFEGDFHAYLHAEKSTSLYFFLEIYQRSSKLAILGNMVMPGYTHSHSINSKELFMFVYRLKIGLILHVFLEILQGYHKRVIFRTFTMVCYITQRDIINLQEILVFICKQKLTSFPTFFGAIAKMQTPYFGCFWYA